MRKDRARSPCGTDVHILHDTFKVPHTVVVENDFNTCGTCYLCQTGHYPICASRKSQGLELDGGFTKYVAAEERFIFPIPEAMSYDEAALLAPLTCCAHGVMERTDIVPGDVVLVIECTGTEQGIKSGLKHVKKRGALTRIGVTGTKYPCPSNRSVSRR
jgi:threonine dehydrogenase-like Zn-dependent dehydrogenase